MPVVYDAASCKGVHPELPVYEVYRDLCGEEERNILLKHSLRYDVTVMPPMMLGEEYVKTLGHIHSPCGGGWSYPEVFEVLEGEARFLLQRYQDEDVVDVSLVKAQTGDKVLIPPNCGHLIVNASSSRLVTGNVISRFCNQAYRPFIERRGGAYYLLKGERLVRNENYSSIPDIRVARADAFSDDEHTGVLTSLLSSPESFAFLNHPWKFEVQMLPRVRRPNMAVAVTAREVSLAKPIFDEEMKQAALDALENDRYTKGENVLKFEEEFARYIGVRHAVSTSSGTAALHIALVALGLKQGEEVVTTPLSFIATANSVIHAGGVPKFADIRFEDYNIDPALVRKTASRRTKTLLPVHLFGYPADLNALREYCDSKELSMVEDACQAHGATFDGRKVGSFGDVGCFSFYPSKNLWVPGDGGMATTDDEDLARAMAKLADCGRTSHYEHDMVGYTYRLSSVNAAVCRIQLRRLDEWNARRRHLADMYQKMLCHIGEIRLPPRGNSEIQPVYHQFVLLAKHRDELKQWLEEHGIQCGVHYPIPIHLQPVYRKLYGYSGGEFPLSEDFSKKCLSIPMHPFLQVNEAKYTCEQIEDFYKKNERIV